MTIFPSSQLQFLDLQHTRTTGLRVKLDEQQRGSVMIMALISLLILMLAGVALISSSNTSLLTAGNLAFKRDLANQTERAVAAVRAKFVSGALLSQTVLYNDITAENYYAHALPSTNASLPGIPDKLLDSAKTDDITDAATGIKLRYVIDRMCISGTVPDKAFCTMGSFVDDKKGTAGVTKVSAGLGPVYRLTIMALGPRNTQTFTQITFTH